MKTKEEIKALLEKVAGKMDKEWHSQAVHQMAVGIWWLDTIGVKDAEKRTALLKTWNEELPNGFGSNASQLGQKLGRVTKNDKIEQTYAGF